MVGCVNVIAANFLLHHLLRLSLLSPRITYSLFRGEAFRITQIIFIGLNGNLVCGRRNKEI